VNLRKDHYQVLSFELQTPCVWIGKFEFYSFGLVGEVWT